ncbi:MAG: dCTP deaminase [Patescibacteria group bacterium]|nr:dCTP deaminase [Patescibacteria group bacterium]
MLLANSALLEVVRRGELVIDPFSPGCVGAGSIDLHLGSRFRRFAASRNGMGLIELHDEIDARDFTEEEVLGLGEHFLLRPGELGLAVTREKVTLAENLAATIDCRSRFARFGLGVACAKHIQPGISSHIVLELTNPGPSTLGLPRGLCVCQLIVYRCEGVGRHNGRHAHQDAP